MSTSTHTREVRNALLSRLDRGNCEQTTLIDAVSYETDRPRSTVVETFTSLEQAGELYVVNGVAKRT